MENKEIQLLEAGLGNVTWWGYSPSFNILKDIEAATQNSEFLLCVKMTPESLGSPKRQIINLLLLLQVPTPAGHD